MIIVLLFTPGAAASGAFLIAVRAADFTGAVAARDEIIIHAVILGAPVFIELRGVLAIRRVDHFAVEIQDIIPVCFRCLRGTDAPGRIGDLAAGRGILHHVIHQGAALGHSKNLTEIFAVDKTNGDSILVMTVIGHIVLHAAADRDDLGNVVAPGVEGIAVVEGRIDGGSGQAFFPEIGSYGQGILINIERKASFGGVIELIAEMEMDLIHAQKLGVRGDNGQRRHRIGRFAAERAGGNRGKQDQDADQGRQPVCTGLPGSGSLGSCRRSGRRRGRSGGLRFPISGDSVRVPKLQVRKAAVGIGGIFGRKIKCLALLLKPRDLPLKIAYGLLNIRR